MEFYIGHSLAESSQRQYRKAEMRLQAFCEARGIEDKLRFSPRVIEQFVAHLGGSGMAPGAVCSTLSAIRHRCRVTDTPVTFDTPRLKLLLRGLSRCHTPVRSRLPFISLSRLGKLVAATSIVASHADAVRLRACFCLAFFGLLRASEVSTTKSTPAHQLLRSSLRLTRSGISLTFKSFKAMSGPPVTIRLSKLVNSPVCPWSAMREYLSVYTIAPGDRLFDLPASSLSHWLRRCAAATVNPGDFTIHSFRRGGATWYAKQGWSEVRLKRQGRWSSDAYQRYIKE